MQSEIFNQSGKSIKVKQMMFCFLIIFQLALFYNLSHKPLFLQDSQEFINSAKSFETERNFYAGPNELEKDYRLYSKRTPIYPIILYGFRFFNIHLNFVYILQLFVGLFNIYMAFILLKIFIKNENIPQLILATGIIFTPSQFIYSQFLMADLWLQSFVMMMMLAFAKFIQTQKPYWLILIILISTMAALTKPVFLLASFIVAFYGIYYFLFKSNKKYLAIACLLPFVSWYTLSSQNKKLTGLFHYSSIGYINLLHYNTNLFLVKTMEKNKREAILEPLMIVPHNKTEFKKNYEEVNTVCKNILLSNLPAYLMFHMKGMVYFFLDPGRFDIYNFLRIENENSNGFLHKGASNTKIKTIYSQHPFIFIGLILVFMVNIFKTIGFIGFIWKYRKTEIMWVGTAMVFYLAFLTGPLGASRFALPVELIIICFAVVFYSSFKRRLKLTTIKNH